MIADIFFTNVRACRRVCVYAPVSIRVRFTCGSYSVNTNCCVLLSLRIELSLRMGSKQSVLLTLAFCKINLSLRMESICDSW